MSRQHIYNQKEEVKKYASELDKEEPEVAIVRLDKRTIERTVLSLVLYCQTPYSGVVSFFENRDTIAIENYLSTTGFFVILSNDSKDPAYVIGVYRSKDVVEKSFENLKNDLDLDRLHVHSDKAMQGRIFIGFIALILTSYIRNVMQQHSLYKTFTFSSLLVELKKLKIGRVSNQSQNG